METIWVDKRKSRKEHVCDTCRSKIYPGEVYEVQTNKFNGDLYKWKQCSHCKEVLTKMFKSGYFPDGITDQDFDNFLADHEIDFKRR